MAEVDAKPRASAQFGCVIGLALLLFAGALVATAQFAVEVPGDARRLLDVSYHTTAFSGAAGAAASPSVQVATAAAPFSGVATKTVQVAAALPVAVGSTTPVIPVIAAPVGSTTPVIPVAAPLAPLLAKVAATVLNCDDSAYLEVAAGAGSVSLTVKKAHSFIVGQRLSIEATGGYGNTFTQQEEHFIAAAGPGRSITLRKPLIYTHAIGAKVCIQKLSLHQQFRHQFSTGSLDSSKSADSSTGSISQSSDSWTSVESGSSADNLPKFGFYFSGTGYGSSLFFNFIIMLCYACCYKSKVVDSSPVMQQQSRQHDLDDFQHGICDCWKDINMCCMVTCCPFVRMAHTNAVTNTCGFWNTLILLGCSTLLCTPLAPCCMQVYFRIHIKDHMGIQDHCFNDMVLAWCCLPCITGQQAMSADAVLGVRFKFPCSVERDGGYGGYGGPEQQQFYS